MKKGRLLTAVLLMTWGIFCLNLVTAQTTQSDKNKTVSKPATVKSGTPTESKTQQATPATPAKAVTKQATSTVAKATPVAAQDITGYWLTAQKATIVQFYKSGDKFNGKGVWSKQKDKNGRPLKDVNNPDKTKRNRNIEGIDLIWDLTYNPKTDTYEGGKIYQPNTGKTFNCKVKLDKNKNVMQVTGGVGFISKTLTWTRTSGIPGGKPVSTQKQ